jgi:hypothetical protein
MSQGKIYKTSKLDVKNISEGFILYEKLNIWFWFNYGVRPITLFNSFYYNKIIISVLTSKNNVLLD